jgi:hypothetical protein
VVLLDSCWHNLRFTRSGKCAYLGARREDIHDHDSYTPEDLLHHSPTPVPQDSESEPEIDPVDVEICHTPTTGITPQETSPHTPIATYPGPPNVQRTSLYPTRQEQPQETHLPTMGTSNVQTITQTPTISQSSGVGLLGSSGSNPLGPGDRVCGALLRAFGHAPGSLPPDGGPPIPPRGGGGEGGGGGGGGGGPPAGQPPAVPQLPIAPAGGDVRQLGHLPTPFRGDRSQANDFIDALGTYFRANIGIPGFESPI